MKQLMILKARVKMEQLLINIATTTNDIAIIRTNVDGQEKLPRYYVEEPTSPGIIENIRT